MQQLDEVLRKQREQDSPAIILSSSSRTCANFGVTEVVGGVALKPCSWCKAVVFCGKAYQAQWRDTGRCAREKKIEFAGREDWHCAFLC